MGALLRTFSTLVVPLALAAAGPASAAFANENDRPNTSNIAEVAESEEYSLLAQAIFDMEDLTLKNESVGILIRHGANPAIEDLDAFAERIRGYIDNKVVGPASFDIRILEDPDMREGLSAFYLFPVGTIAFNPETFATVAYSNDELVTLMDQTAESYSYIKHGVQTAAFIPAGAN